MLDEGLGASSINQRLAAIKNIVHEAADNQLLDPAVAASIDNVPGAKQKGQRVGLKDMLLHVYRQKVQKQQMHHFSTDLLLAVRASFGADDAPVLRVSKRQGRHDPPRHYRTGVGQRECRI